MRYVFSAIIVCALGIPAAFALPTAGASHVAMTNSDMTLVAKRSGGNAKSTSSAKASRTARGKTQDNGIHPLVGSGDY